MIWVWTRLWTILTRTSHEHQHLSFRSDELSNATAKPFLSRCIPCFLNTKLPRALSIPMQKSHRFSFTFKTPSRLLFWFLCKRKKKKSTLTKFLHQIASYPLIRRAECSFLFLHTAHESGLSPAVSPASPERICRQLQHRERGLETPPTAPTTPPRDPSCALIGELAFCALWKCYVTSLLLSFPLSYNTT